MVSQVLSFFPRGVLDEILNLIELVSEGFPSYSFEGGVTLEKGIQNMNNIILYMCFVSWQPISFIYFEFKAAPIRLLMKSDISL